ncbi:bacteriohemerythrin [Bacterioplanoides sp.]|uniref:bacteriohemerythrin n=1 Tax=Bacterioplanoides sp. TaxID=2066072 RepID=UPI003AFFC23D
MEFQDYPQVAMEFMNRDHEEFVTLLNKAEQKLLMGGKFTKHLKKLYNHCVEHFAHEEAEMLASHFPPYDMHKQEHERVLALFREQLEHYEKHQDDEAALEFIEETIPQWFIMHLNTMDKVTAQYLYQRKGNVA